MLIVAAVFLMATFTWVVAIYIVHHPQISMMYSGYKSCEMCNQWFPENAMMITHGKRACVGCSGGMLATQLLIEQVGAEKAQELREKLMFSNMLSAITSVGKVG